MPPTMPLALFCYETFPRSFDSQHTHRILDSRLLFVDCAEVLVPAECDSGQGCVFSRTFFKCHLSRPRWAPRAAWPFLGVCFFVVGRPLDPADTLSPDPEPQCAGEPGKYPDCDSMLGVSHFLGNLPKPCPLHPFTTSSLLLLVSGMYC